MADQLTHDDFASRVGETFRLTSAAGDTLELTLAEATVGSDENRVPGGRVPFSLIFHGPTDRYAPQGTWPLEHDDLGTLEIFLVPLEPEGEAMRYQAVFS